jgi:hypothetical protein
MPEGVLINRSYGGFFLMTRFVSTHTKLLVLSATIAAAPQLAQAQSTFFPPYDQPQTTNVSYLPSNPSRREIFLNQGECLFLEALDNNGNDIAFRITAPDGVYWQGDFYASNFEDLGVYAYVSGTYLVQVGHWFGAGNGSRIEIHETRTAPDTTNCPFIDDPVFDPFLVF